MLKVKEYTLEFRVNFQYWVEKNAIGIISVKKYLKNKIDTHCRNSSISRYCVMK
jgi:hypothetical protein